MKPCFAPGKRTRSILPPAFSYARTSASVIAAGTLSSISGCAIHAGGSARARPPSMTPVTLAAAMAASADGTAAA